MTSKKMLVGSGLFVLLTGLVLSVYYNLTHLQLFNFTPQQTADMGTALKGALGEAIFSGQQPEQGVPAVDKACMSRSACCAEWLIDAYQKDPQKFKRYADMLDTANNAKQVGDVLLKQGGSHPPHTSDPLAIEANGIFRQLSRTLAVQSLA